MKAATKQQRRTIPTPAPALAPADKPPDAAPATDTAPLAELPAFVAVLLFEKLVESIVSDEDVRLVLGTVVPFEVVTDPVPVAVVVGLVPVAVPDASSEERMELISDVFELSGVAVKP